MTNDAAEEIMLVVQLPLSATSYIHMGAFLRVPVSGKPTVAPHGSNLCGRASASVAKHIRELPMVGTHLRSATLALHRFKCHLAFGKAGQQVKVTESHPGTTIGTPMSVRGSPSEYRQRSWRLSKEGGIRKDSWPSWWMVIN